MTIRSLHNAATKQASELLCHAQSRLHGTPHAPAFASSPRTVLGSVPISRSESFTGSLLEGEELPRYGGGGTARDHTFMDDIVRGVTSALDFTRRNEGRYDVINLGESRTVTLAEMIPTVGQVFGRKPRIKALPMQLGDVERTYQDVSRARELLGYRPSTEFIDGMKIFASWYLSEGGLQDGITEP